MSIRITIALVVALAASMLIGLGIGVAYSESPEDADFAYLNIGSRSYRIYAESALHPTEDLRELCDTSLKGAGFREITFKDDKRTRYQLTLIPWRKAEEMHNIAVLVDIDSLTKSVIGDDEFDKWLKSKK